MPSYFNTSFASIFQSTIRVFFIDDLNECTNVTLTTTESPVEQRQTSCTTATTLHTSTPKNVVKTTTTDTTANISLSSAFTAFTTTKSKSTTFSTTKALPTGKNVCEFFFFLLKKMFCRQKLDMVLNNCTNRLALRMCYYKKLFWKYAVNLQENTHANVPLLKWDFGIGVLL